jgi:predicted SAM-dependent methyltransferase
LHFAPESVLVKYFSSFNPIEYITADLCNNADVVENIEKISFNDNSFNIVFCSHVLEHVDDKKAFKEIFRVLKPGGKLITMIPICEGWDITYENKDITTDNGRVLHFGQRDHVRYYGRDFVSRVESAGFTVNSFTGSPEEVIRYGLIRGEKIFVCQKAG